MTLLPIAYITFYLLMNQKTLLGDDLPHGGKRIAWNIVMAVACLVTAFISIWTIWSSVRWLGIAAVAAFLVLALVAQLMRSRSR
jgi:hypothetical protein